MISVTTVMTEKRHRFISALQFSYHLCNKTGSDESILKFIVIVKIMGSSHLISQFSGFSRTFLYNLESVEEFDSSAFPF